MTDFENAMKKVADLLQTAAKKSGEIFENTKISYNISTEKDKIVKIQSQIGATFYKIFKEGGSVPECIIEDLNKISAIEDNIRALEKTIADTKSYKFCVDCGAKLELSDVYCAKCGAKQRGESAKPTAEDEKADDADECCEDDCDCGCDKDGE